MDALLIPRWLAGASSIRIHDEASVVLVRAEVARVGAAAGLASGAIGKLTIAASELATNQFVHARGGEIAVRAFDREGVAGVEVIAADRGEGIVDPVAAIEGTTLHPRGLGVGLSGVMRLADEVDFDVRFGAGTCIWARKLARPTARRREVAILARPLAGEPTSGDDACFVRTDRALVLALADGLGHGPDARAPAARAIDAVLADPSLEPATLVGNLARSFADPRGTVLAVVSIDEGQGALDFAAVGNVTTRVLAPRAMRSFSGSSSFLGAKPPPRAYEESTALSARDRVTMFSDGLRSRFDSSDSSGFDDLAGRHPLVVAWDLLRRYGRESDDATVLVAG